MARAFHRDLDANRKPDGADGNLCTRLDWYVDNLNGLFDFRLAWRERNFSPLLFPDSLRCVDVHLPRLGYSDFVGYINVRHAHTVV